MALWLKIGHTHFVSVRGLRPATESARRRCGLAVRAFSPQALWGDASGGPSLRTRPFSLALKNDRDDQGLALT